MVLSFSVTLTLMAFFFFLLINRYRRSLEKKRREAIANLLTGQENERERLARDIHDEIGPRLSLLYGAMSELQTGAGKEALYEEMKDSLKETIANVRRVSHDLMSPSLIKYGLVEAIKENLKRRIKKTPEIQFDTNSNGMEYSDIIKSNLYKITQELIYNTEKHSNAAEVKISLMLVPSLRQLIYTYKDNGSTSKPIEEAESGIGIKNIRTRVDVMKGVLEINLIQGFYAKIVLNY